MERNPAELVAGELAIDLNSRRVIASDREINLTGKEFDILSLLARHPGWVCSQEQILGEVWGTSAFIDARVVAVHIGNLRAKLRLAGVDRVAIENVRGAGYKLRLGSTDPRRSAAGNLTGGPHLPTGPASLLPPPAFNFVGRIAELALLDSRYSSLAEQRRGGAVVLYGEAGIGKSRLAEEWSERLNSDECLFVRTCCRTDAPVLQPWTEVLQKLHGRAEAGAVDVLARHLADFAELAPLGESGGEAGHPSDVAIDPARSRFRLFSRVASFLRLVAAPRPVVVLLDDLGHADEASLALLEFLAPDVSTIPVLLVLAIREGEPERSPALARTVDVLQRHGPADWIHLDGLREDEARAYAEHLLGSLATPDLLDSLYRETDGNPLYFTEAMRSLLAGRTWQSGVSRVPRDDRLRLLVGQRLAGLSSAAQATVAAASVLLRGIVRQSALGRRGRFPGPVSAVLGRSGGRWCPSSCRRAASSLSSRPVLGGRLRGFGGSTPDGTSRRRRLRFGADAGGQRR